MSHYSPGIFIWQRPQPCGRTRVLWLPFCRTHWAGDQGQCPCARFLRQTERVAAGLHRLHENPEKPSRQTLRSCRQVTQGRSPRASLPWQTVPSESLFPNSPRECGDGRGSVWHCVRSADHRDTRDGSEMDVKMCSLGNGVNAHTFCNE